MYHIKEEEEEMVIDGCWFFHVHRETENNKSELGLAREKGTISLCFRVI